MILDDSDIVMANLAFLDSSAEAQINRRFCWKAVDFLRDAVAMADLDTDDDLAHRRLGIRLINNAGAFGRCALGGYYQPALAMIRDIVEIGFLLELFVHDRSHLETWRTATVARRSRLYKPIQVREMLDKYSPAGKSDRDDAYKFLSMHGTHVSPSAVQVISPNATTMLGPFADRDRVTLITFDIAKFLGYATTQFGNSVRSEGISDRKKRLAFRMAKLTFMEAYLTWRSETHTLPGQPVRLEHQADNLPVLEGGGDLT